MEKAKELCEKQSEKNNESLVEQKKEELTLQDLYFPFSLKLAFKNPKHIPEDLNFKLSKIMRKFYLLTYNIGSENERTIINEDNDNYLENKKMPLFSTFYLSSQPIKDLYIVCQLTQNSEFSKEATEIILDYVKAIDKETYTFFNKSKFIDMKAYASTLLSSKIKYSAHFDMLSISERALALLFLCLLKKKAIKKCDVYRATLQNIIDIVYEQNSFSNLELILNKTKFNIEKEERDFVLQKINDHINSLISQNNLDKNPIFKSLLFESKILQFEKWSPNYFIQLSLALQLQKEESNEGYIPQTDSLYYYQKLFSQMKISQKHIGQGLIIDDACITQALQIKNDIIDQVCQKAICNGKSPLAMSEETIIQYYYEAVHLNFLLFYISKVKINTNSEYVKLQLKEIEFSETKEELLKLQIASQSQIEQATKETKQLKKENQKLHEENAKNKKLLQNLKADDIKKQKQEIEFLKVELNAAKEKNLEQEKQIKNINREILSANTLLQKLKFENQELCNTVKESENAAFELQKLKELFSSEEIVESDFYQPKILYNKIAFIGGRENWISKISQYYPNAIFIGPDELNFDLRVLSRCDLIVIASQYIPHSLYYPVIECIRKKQYNMIYIKGTNHKTHCKLIEVNLIKEKSIAL